MTLDRFAHLDFIKCPYIIHEPLDKLHLFHYPIAWTNRNFLPISPAFIIRKERIFTMDCTFEPCLYPVWEFTHRYILQSLHKHLTP